MTQKMNIHNPQHRELMIEQILKGHMVALPTETVYGLAVRADDDQAVMNLFKKKGRPSFNPLIVHYASWEDVAATFAMNSCEENLARHFWPGPLTLVLDRPPDLYIASCVSANLPTLAVRVPDHDFTRSLIRDIGCPLAMPSANRSGRLSPTSPEHVLADFPHDDTILIADGGACTLGLESTVVDARNPQQISLLRPGIITKEDLKPWGNISSSSDLKNNKSSSHLAKTPSSPSSPGCLTSHYAPSRPLRMNVTTPLTHEAFLGFSGSPLATRDLSPQGCLREASKNLYHDLHLLDREPFTSIAVAPIPNQGLGITINDRLARAASSRPTNQNLPS